MKTGAIANIAIFVALAYGIVNPGKVELVVSKLKQAISSGTAVENTVVPSVTVDPKFQSAAEQAAVAFAANKQKAQAFRGYFGLIANEARNSKYLATTNDIVQLTERASDRFNAILNSPPVTNGAQVAKAMNDVLKLGIGEEIVPLTTELRESAAKAFEALEWAIQEASK